MEIRLTQRPYLLLEKLEGHGSLRELFTVQDLLSELPKSIQAQLLPALQRPWSERTAFFASIAKRHKRLKDLLWEEGGSLGEGWMPSEKYRATGVPDALMLLEEDHRMAQTN